MTDILGKKISNKSVHVGIIGMGYVGLPLMNSICSKGILVTGFDIDSEKVEKLNHAESYLETLSSKSLQKHVEAGLFKASCDFSKFTNMDVIIICVPTPLDKHRNPDLSYVENTAAEIAKYLRKDQLIILESTTYPGTTSDILKPIFEDKGLKSGADFYLAYSPEREDPGNKDFHTATTPKVVGGDGAAALELSYNFYSLFIDSVIKVSSPETAEAVKITENIFRAVNIALVNELKVLYEKMGIDIWEVVDAAKTKPFGYMPFYPGPGLGGHCIPIDPFYLTWKARELDMSTRFIELAGEINTQMPSYVVEKTIAALNDIAQKPAKNAKILVIGIAYKKNINDQRETPAFPIITMLEKLGAQVDFHDPHIPEILPNRHFPSLAGRQSVPLNKTDLPAYDAVIIVTDHDSVDYYLLSNHCALIIDTRNAFKGQSGNAHIVKA